MVGAIIGDICGSIYEFNPVKSNDFRLMDGDVKFTDDSVLSIAVADAILHSKPFSETIKEYAKRYPNMSYGHRFRQWVNSESREPYNSFGNGSAMRVAAIGFYYNDEESTLIAARQSAEVTHNHPEGIKGAQAIALGIFLARQGKTKEDIKKEIELRFNYDLNRSFKMVAAHYGFNETCQGSVPEAIIAFLDSTDFESAIRNAIMLKGDADTQACMAGALAEAYYGIIPNYMKEKMYELLPIDLHIIVKEFKSRSKKYTKDERQHNNEIKKIKHFMTLIEAYKTNKDNKSKREILLYWVSMLPGHYSYGRLPSTFSKEKKLAFRDHIDLRRIQSWTQKAMDENKANKYAISQLLLSCYALSQDLIEEWNNLK